MRFEKEIKPEWVFGEWRLGVWMVDGGWWMVDGEGRLFDEWGFFFLGRGGVRGFVRGFL